MEFSTIERREIDREMPETFFLNSLFLHTYLEVSAPVLPFIHVSRGRGYCVAFLGFFFRTKSLIYIFK